MNFKDKFLKYDISKIALLICILILILTITNIYKENQMLKSRLGTTYHYAVGGVLWSAYRDLEFTIQENDTIDGSKMEVYATYYKLNNEELLKHYRQWRQIPEIKDFALLLYSKTQEVADSLNTGEYEKIPKDIKEDLIFTIQSGTETFMALHEDTSKELKLFNQTRSRTRWYNALHKPSNKVSRIIKDGLSPVLSIEN